MRLDQLLSQIGLYFDRASGVDIRDLTLDSRQVTEGSLFIAIQGSETHGMTFVDQAIANGAAAILYDAWGEDVPKHVPALHVTGLQAQIGPLAHAFYGHPCQAMRVIGVTGTNGKTTTVHLIAQLADTLGLKAARIGTLGISIGPDKLVDSDRTTPDAITLAKIFSELRDREVDLVAMEVSSHALDQHRVDGIPFDVAVMTNLSRDHLDYHQDMESYGQAKARLFEDFDLKVAVLNADDAFCQGLMKRLASSHLVTYGTSSSADFSIKAVEATSDGSLIDVSIHGALRQLKLPLLGDFNVENALAAVAVMTAIEPEKAEQVLSAMSRLQTAPGRMECFQSPGSATVVVDYAHTPDALERALVTCRKHCQGQLWSVFGCGGDRDTGKRPLMGRIAAELSDCVVLTSDNPRSEPPQAILNEIRAGMTKPPMREEIDRSMAIRFAVENASSNDYILIAGKGHESTQVIGQTTRPLSDRVEVARLFGLMDQEVQHAS